MKRKRIALSAVALMMISALSYGMRFHEKESDNEYATPRDAAFHLAYSMDKETYGNFEAIGGEAVSGEKIYGGITSHHLLAAGKIARFFSAFQGQRVKTVVIIGPNHFNTGVGKVLVSRYPYETPWGTVQPDTEVIDRLLSKKVVRNEEGPFANEHSVSSLVSFARYYLPEARIVPIIMKRNTSIGQADKLAAALVEILPEDAIVIASVDFSHHLDKTAADFHDEKSVADINDFDFAGLAESEIDSPASIRVLLKFLEMRGARKMAWERTSSAEILADPHYEDVTSYLFAHFTAGEGEKGGKITLLSFGDIFAEQSEADSLFEKIRGREGNFLRGADIISVGIVGSFLESDCAAGKLTVKELDKLGINLLALANASSRRCEAELEAKGVGYFQTDAAKGENVFRGEKIGRKIAIVGVRGDANLADFVQYYDQIKEIRRDSDAVIAAVRWGAAKGSFFKKGVAHALIDSGADLVIGYGEEIGSMEKYHGKIIFYSLGTFPPGDGLGQNRLGVGTVFGNDETRYYLFPLKLDTDSPELVGAKDAETYCAGYLRDVAGAEGCSFAIKNDRY